MLTAEYFGARRKEKYKKIYETKGNPDEYNLDKVLEVLGESNKNSEPTKKKNKKKKNTKPSKEESVSNSENGKDSTTKLSNQAKKDDKNDTIKDSFETHDVKDVGEALECPVVRLEDGYSKSKPNKNKSKKKCQKERAISLEGNTFDPTLVKPKCV